MTTWREVHHQAERCRRMHVREQQIAAAKLLFEMLREALQAKPPAGAGGKPASRPGR